MKHDPTPRNLKTTPAPHPGPAEARLSTSREELRALVRHKWHAVFIERTILGVHIVLIAAALLLANALLIGTPGQIGTPY